MSGFSKPSGVSKITSTGGTVTVTNPTGPVVDLEVSGGSGGITQLTGDVTAGPGSGSQAATLAAVATASTEGDASHTVTVQIDAKGRVLPLVQNLISITVSQISNLAATLAGYLALTGGAMTGAIAMGTNKITGLANGTAASDAAAFGQIPVPANGYGITGNTGATPTPAVSLTQTNNSIPSSTITLTHGTETTVATSDTLQVGTYLCLATVMVQAGATPAELDGIIEAGTASINYTAGSYGAVTPAASGWTTLTMISLFSVTSAGTLIVKVANQGSTTAADAIAHQGNNEHGTFSGTEILCLRIQ